MFGEVGPKLRGKGSLVDTGAIGSNLTGQGIGIQSVYKGGLSACQAYATGTQTISTATATTVSYSTKNFDTGNFFNTSTSYYTPLIQGYYYITAQITFAPVAAATGTVLAYLAKNGTVVAETFLYPISLTNYIGLNIAKLVLCNGSTDYLSVQVYQSTGMNATLSNPDGQIDNYVSIVLFEPI
jgi:hypothetical protein